VASSAAAGPADHMAVPLIELQDVWKIYTLGDVEVHALHGVSVSISAGEFVAIIGASGSG